MSTTYFFISLLLISLIIFVSSTETFVVSSSEGQMMVSRRLNTGSENVRMTGSGNGSVENDDDTDDDDGNDDDDDEDDNSDTDDQATPTADEIFRCTERGSTGTPIYPLCPEGFPEGDDSDDAATVEDDDEDAADDDYASTTAGDDAISYDKDCEAIRSGSEISANEYVHKLTYQIDLALEIDGDIAETLARLEEFLQTNIATDLTGCNPDSAVASDVDLQYVLFDVIEDTKSSECYG